MLSLIAKKLGMSHLYDESGTVVPFTMVQLYDNCVVDVMINENKEFDNLLIGYDKVDNAKKVAKPLAGVFTKKNIPLHKKIYGCKVKKGGVYKIGDVIAAESVLKVGDMIDVTGVSLGKGFAGVMKRHNFRGLEASHGVSVSHRSHGSTGQRQDPGKVFKGKKMAGHMGVDKITVKNLQVLIVDKEKKLVAIKGAIPGNAGIDVVLRIAN
jgi:large subunit ribosomal protein L3